MPTPKSRPSPPSCKSVAVAGTGPTGSAPATPISERTLVRTRSAGWFIRSFTSARAVSGGSGAQEWPSPCRRPRGGGPGRDQSIQQQAHRGKDRAGGGGRRVDQESDEEDYGCDETSIAESYRSVTQRNEGSNCRGAVARPAGRQAPMKTAAGIPAHVGIQHCLWIWKRFECRRGPGQRSLVYSSQRFRKGQLVGAQKRLGRRRREAAGSWRRRGNSLDTGIKVTGRWR